MTMPGLICCRWPVISYGDLAGRHCAIRLPSLLFPKQPPSWEILRSQALQGTGFLQPGHCAGWGTLALGSECQWWLLWWVTLCQIWCIFFSFSWTKTARTFFCLPCNILIPFSHQCIHFVTSSPHFRFLVFCLVLIKSVVVFEIVVKNLIFSFNKLFLICTRYWIFLKVIRVIFFVWRSDFD